MAAMWPSERVGGSRGLIFNVRVFLIKVICFYDRYDFISKTNMDTLDCIFFSTSTSRHAIKLLFISYNIAFHFITLKYKAATGATSVLSVDSASSSPSFRNKNLPYINGERSGTLPLWKRWFKCEPNFISFFYFIFVCVPGGRVNLYNSV